jgi:hypothetical protein
MSSQNIADVAISLTHGEKYPVVIEASRLSDAEKTRDINNP